MVIPGDINFTREIIVLVGVPLLITAGIAVYYGVRWWKQCVQAGCPPQYRLKELLLFIMMLTPALAGAGKAAYSEIRILLCFLAASMALGGILGWLHTCLLYRPVRPNTSVVVIYMLAGALVFPFLVCLTSIALAVGLVALFY